MQNNVIKFLQGKKVYLRPIENEDLDLFYTNLWNEEMRRLTGTQAVFSRIGVQKWFDGNSLNPDRIDLVICLQENDQVIGDIAMLDIDRHNRNAVVRIAIFAEEYCGNGYGTEALRLLLAHGFDVQNLHRIELDVYSYNIRAKKSYEKLGFKQEGIKRDEHFYNGEYHDSIQMSILEDEFRDQ